MSQREIKKVDPKWVIIALIGAIAVAAGLSGTLGSVDLTPQVVDRVDSTPFSADLTSGPISGMPRSTFERLTAGNVAVGLDSGAVAGMPRSTFEHLTGEPVLDIENGPVPGVPQSTYEQLAG
jgi:hypothetical protein